MRVVYIAGKFSDLNAWRIELNIRKAEELGLQVAELGASPLIPHANARSFHGTRTPQFWYDATLALLVKSDAVLTVDNWHDSAGALNEVDTALRMGIPVFHSLDDLESWLRHG
jgi:hypothetical protein